MAWYCWKGTLLILELRVQPRARENEIAGLMGERLRVRVKSPPVDDRANQCLAEFLGAQFGVSASKVELISGGQRRDKRVAIHAPARQPDWFRSLMKKESG